MALITPIPFWEKPLAELSPSEWEQLCDGCARCCLINLEDEDSGEVVTTSVACRYLEQKSCGCRVYNERTDLVPECLQVTPENVSELDWMPLSCSYRLRAEGRPLTNWHPLMSGNRETIHDAGISIRHLAILENELGENKELEDYIISDLDHN